jgi:glycerol-3-phosphate dehydrogenase
MAEANSNPCLRPTLGIHIIIPWSLWPSSKAVMLISQLDNRPFFVIPCRERNIVIIGTTDTDFTGDLDSLFASSKDVQYLLNSFNYYFPQITLKETDIISTYAGLRPLLDESGKTTSQVSREHKIFESPENLFHIAGGKLTTYRKMAMDLLDFIAKRKIIAVSSQTITDSHPLYGGEIPDFSHYLVEKSNEIVKEFGLADDIAHHIILAYGSHVEDLLKIIKQNTAFKERILPGLPYILAQIPYAIQHEMAMSLDDFLTRRIHVLWLDKDQGKNIASSVANQMGSILGWDAETTQKQVQHYFQQISWNNQFRQSN